MLVFYNVIYYYILDLMLPLLKQLDKILLHVFQKKVKDVTDRCLMFFKNNNVLYKTQKHRRFIYLYRQGPKK